MRFVSVVPWLGLVGLIGVAVSASGGAGASVSLVEPVVVSSSVPVVSVPVVSVPVVDDVARLSRIGVPADQIPIFVGASQRTGLDALHLAAQVKAESGFQNHPCRWVNRGTRNENHICGIAQLGNGWGTAGERMDVTYSINRQADGIAEYMLAYDGNWQMAWRKYQSGTPYQGGNCGKHCRKYVSNIERYVVDGSSN